MEIGEIDDIWGAIGSRDVRIGHTVEYSCRF